MLLIENNLSVLMKRFTESVQSSWNVVSCLLLSILNLHYSLWIKVGLHLFCVAYTLYCYV